MKDFINDFIVPPVIAIAFFCLFAWGMHSLLSWLFAPDMTDAYLVTDAFGKVHDVVGCNPYNFGQGVKCFDGDAAVYFFGDYNVVEK